ncbi:hypothetical protein SLE2022_187750 [Rubroshorea leprosula]
MNTTAPSASSPVVNHFSLLPSQAHTSAAKDISSPHAFRLASSPLLLSPFSSAIAEVDRKLLKLSVIVTN